MQEQHGGRIAPHRLEDAALITGAGRYTDDIRVDGVLDAAFVRSYLPHGRVLDIDTSGVIDLPGVAAVFTADDLRLPDLPGATGRGPDVPMPRPPLARDRVRYVGEPLAIVVAEGRPRAADAAELWVELDPLPVVADPLTAVRDESLLFPASGSNVLHRSSLGVDEEADDQDAGEVSVTIVTENQRLAPAPIEPLAILAVPGVDGSLTVHCGHQAPHRLRGQLSRFLGRDVPSLRVVVPEVGGAFGMKGMLYPEYLAVCAAALELGRPVRWAETRTEHFLGGTHGRGMRHTVTLTGDPDGRIRRARVHLLVDVGAYPHNGTPVGLFARFVAGGPYDIQDLRATVEMVVTNRAPTGSYRGAGRPEAAYAVERAVDAYARACDLDPVEVRRRNLVRPEQMPYRTATGALYDSGDYPAALERALELADVDGVRREQARRRAAGSAEPAIGIGIGSFVERAGGAIGSDEYADVRLGEDGRVTVRIGTAASGQGHLTSWAWLVARAWGVEPAEVEVVHGDTAQVPDGTGSFASRSAQIGGSSLHLASQRLQQRVRGLVADELEANPDDLEFGDGRVSVRGDRTSGVDLTEVATLAAEHEVELFESERFAPDAQTFPYGTHVAVVEVDLETGAVDLRLLAAVDDCGTVLHPEIVEGQVIGSLVQGVAQALYEAIVYDEDGQPKTTTFAEYHLPSAVETPTIVTDRLVHPAPSNPLGAKGAGESGCIGAPPAIVNAVLDALAPLGVEDLSMPLTPGSVWRALQEASARVG